MVFNLVQNAEQVLIGSFAARAVYGGEYIDPAFNVGGDDDAEKADDYRGYLASQGDWNLLDASDLPNFDDRNGDARFTSGGLYNARVEATFTNSFDAQGMLAVKDGDTLVLTFRGTDGKDPAVESGQTFSGLGLAANYKAFKPLINAAYDYLASHPEITEVVVSGHSLGGALTDVFTMVDADRFRALRPDGLTIVSLGSSGIPPDLPQHLSGIDSEAAVIGKKVIGEILGVKITVDVIKSLIRPADYISITNAEDRAHFPNDFPSVPEDAGLVPIATLKDNLQFGGDLVFHVPNISNSDVEYYDPLERPADFRGIGAQHNSALLWANVQGLVHDDLFRFHDGQRLTVGITDYNAVPDFDGTPIALFEGYLELNNPDIVNDQGSRTLVGTAGQDYMLGLVGDDRIEGRGGNDVLSGGEGKDAVFGGAGSDIISGGAGADLLIGGGGRDRFFFTSISQSVPGEADIIRDFTLGIDRIVLSVIDAKTSEAGNQAFAFIGDAAFSAEGQIRAVQKGTDTVLSFNITGETGAEMHIRLQNVTAADLSGLNFIL